jgi:hypothetical protein
MAMPRLITANEATPLFPVVGRKRDILTGTTGLLASVVAYRSAACATLMETTKAPRRHQILHPHPQHTRDVPQHCGNAFPHTSFRSRR